ncbi:hypothetical protein WH297_20950 [Ochrobactrum vermis]|uniref:DUF3426 domain-containing protein n=1 Tax=Ochrobactrum vermis TaxID=1827297 RepID=A0ABU8PJH7_9HYPH|nr:hypothetical protein [Ochrobactrum vermis]PQZ26460.1 hypothetical protein CQZ93_21270 [Ochrobactrum vermis]
MSKAISSGERKSFWICLALLAIALPLAIFVHSDGGLLRWIEQKLREPTIVARGEIQTYAGGNWKLVALDKFPGTLPKTNVVLAEIEVAIQDPDRLKQSMPCSLTAMDEQGRNWSTLYLSGRIIKELKPEAADKPQCFNLASENGDGPIHLVESFLVPEDVGELSLSLSMLGEQPERLVLK